MSDDNRIMQIEASSPLIATAIHDGHEVSERYAELTGLSESERLMEEDPFTGRLARLAPSSIVARTSRFQVDLNRPRETAVYRSPADAWGMHVWKTSTPPEELLNEWLDEYDRFYAEVERQLAGLLERHERVFVLDLHSYRHRRDADNPEREEPQELNPDINLGMGNIAEMHGETFEPAVVAFEKVFSAIDMPGRGALDVRRNIKFMGANFSRTFNAAFPGRVCVLAVEFKKIFMDEWTGELDEEAFARLEQGMRDVQAPLIEALKD